MPTVYRLHTTPKRAHTQLVERVCAPGPEVEGDTGSGVPKTAFVTPWAASLSFDNELQLQERPTISLAKDTGTGGWERQTPLDPPPVVHKAARKLAFCFDQNARPVYAWQAAEAVYITQFSVSDGQYITRGPFTGVDPTLYLDAFALNTFVDSDVILFYLKPNRTEIAYRIQRELYANEYDLVNLFDERIAEAKYYMDQVIPLSYQYQIALWTKNFGKRYLLSNPYPVSLGDDNLGGRFAPLDIHQYVGAQNAAIESILQGEFTPEVLNYFQVILSYVAEHEVQIKAQPEALSYFVQLLAAATETRLDIGAAPVELHHEKILDALVYEHGLEGSFAPTLLDYLMIRAYDVVLENKLVGQLAPEVLSYFANLRAFDLGTETITAQFAPELVTYRDVTLFADKTHSMNVSAKPNEFNHYNVTVPKAVSTVLEVNFAPFLFDYEDTSAPPISNLPEFNDLIIRLTPRAGVFVDDGVTAATPGQTIQEWHSVVGNRVFSQPNAASRPVLGADTVTFTADWLESSPGLALGDGARTVALLLKRGSSSLRCPFEMNDILPTADGNYSIWTTSSTIYIGTAGLANDYTMYAHSVSITGFDLVVITHGVPAGLINGTVYVNGAPVTQTRFRSRLFNTGSDGKMLLGRNGSSSSWFWSGDIAALAVWTKDLTATQISTLTAEDILAV